MLKGFSLITPVIILILAAVTAGIIFKLYGGNNLHGWNNNSSPTISTIFQTSNLPSCGSNNTFFSVSPVPLANLSYVVPLGNLNPYGHTFPTDHIYFTVPSIVDPNGSRYAENVPVVSPGHITITQIQAFNYLSANYTDWTLNFASCREFSAYFHHLASVSDKIQSQFANPDCGNTYSTGGMTFNICSKNVNIELQSGESVGTVGGRVGGSTSLDLGAYDYRAQPLAYANPSRYYSNRLQVVCPLDYFTPDTRSSLQSVLGGDRTLRTIQPLCGQVDQDIAGTAQGNWFVKGSTGQYQNEDPNLALVHDNVDPTRGVFSVGTSTTASGLNPRTYYFTPTHSGFVNRDFGEVKADGNIYCYETQNQGGYGYGAPPPSVVIIIQLTSPTTLQIERLNSGSCGVGLWAFDSSAANFER